MKIKIKFLNKPTKTFDVEEDAYHLDGDMLKIATERGNKTFNQAFNFRYIREILLIEEDEEE